MHTYDLNLKMLHQRLQRLTLPIAKAEKFFQVETSIEKRRTQRDLERKYETPTEDFYEKYLGENSEENLDFTEQRTYKEILNNLVEEKDTSKEISSWKLTDTSIKMKSKLHGEDNANELIQKSATITILEQLTFYHPFHPAFIRGHGGFQGNGNTPPHRRFQSYFPSSR